MSDWRKWLMVFSMMGLGACTPQAPPIPPPQSAWGTVIALGNAPIVESPALMADDEQMWMAWTNAVDGEVRHFGNRFPLPNPTILAIRATYPYAYRILPATRGFAHWLWLDRTADVDELRLQSSVVSRDLVAQIEPVVLSAALTTHFDALSVSDGSLQVVWSEGSLGATRLWQTTIDVRGRASFASMVVPEGDYPTFAQAINGDMWLFWVSQGQVLRGRWANGALSDIARLFTLPPLAVGDRFEQLTVAMDRTRTYVFGQVVGADNQPRTWMSNGGDVPQTWTTPRWLAIASQASPVQTGFNSGAVDGARWGTQAIGWAMPLRGQYDTLPIAITVGDSLGVLYVRNGEPVGVQVLLAVGTLFQGPLIATDSNRHLYITWSQPTEAGANLWLAKTAH